MENEGVLQIAICKTIFCTSKAVFLIVFYHNIILRASNFPIDFRLSNAIIRVE